MIRKLWLTLALCGWALAAFAADTALDRDGNLYHVFPATNQGLSFLQLDIYAKDGTRTSLPVWGTKPLAQVSAPQVVFSQFSSRLYIVFSQGGSTFSDVVLATYSPAEGLSTPYSLSSDHVNRSAINPRVLLTTEIRTTTNNQKVWMQFLHVLWWEDGPQPGAVYASLPVSFQFNGIDNLTRINLGDLLSPGLPPGDLTPLAPAAYQHPWMSALVPFVNRVRVFFLNAATLQYQQLDLSYEMDPDVLQDRAHFPDIGIMMPMPAFPEFQPTQAVMTILGSTGNVAMFSIEPGGITYTTYCGAWTPPSALPLLLPGEEVERMLKGLIEFTQ